MNPTYSVFPLEPDVRAYLSKALTTKDRVSAPPRAVFRQHWIVTVVEGACVLVRSLPTSPITNQLLRIKRIVYEGRAAFLLKTNLTRTRVILQAVGGDINVYASYLDPIDPSKPFFPEYPKKGDPRIMTSTWSLGEYPVYASLAKHIAELLSTPTYYSNPNYKKIQISEDMEATGDDVMWYGSVVDVIESQDPDCLNVVAHSKWNKRHLSVYKKNVRISHPKPGATVLVYCDLDNIDLVRAEDMDAFYEIVDL